MRTALWQAVKKARPTLSDEEIDELLRETALQDYERSRCMGSSLGHRAGTGL